MQAGGNLKSEWQVVAYLMRHGETDWNKENRIQGQKDIPLNANGRKQAEQAAEVLARSKVSACYSSDLSRARETAEIVASRHKKGRFINIGWMGLPKLTPALRERSYGRMEGMTDVELDRDREKNTHLYAEEGWREIATDAEDPVAFSLRLRTFLHHTLTTKNDPILIVSHRPSLREIFRICEAEQTYDPYRPDNLLNCSINTLSYSSNQKKFRVDNIWVPSSPSETIS